MSSKAFTYIGILVLSVLMQGCGVNHILKRADKRYRNGEYYAAAEEYKKAYKKISAKQDRVLKGEVAFKQGECYRVLNSPKAASSYKNAIRYDYALKDSTVYLRHGQALQYQGKYKDAAKAYQEYLKKRPGDYVARSGLKACREAEDWKKEFSRYQVKLSKELNGRRSSSFSPVFVGYETDQIMVTSNRQQKSKDKKKKVKASKITGVPTYNLWETKKDQKGNWEPMTLAEGLYGSDDEGNETPNDSTKTGQREMGACCFTADGKTMYFTYACPESGKNVGAKIYKSERASGEWAEPVEVKLFSDSSITAAHPAISTDGDTLYFVSDAPGGKGGKDIWRGTFENGDWLVENMGEPINTSGDEMYPYIRKDGTLYFASNGHPGYGGLDLFYVQDSTVVNMGAPFNSKNDDFGITYAGDSNDGYFSSNRNQSRGWDQIYEFKLPEMVFLIQGKVLDTKGEPVTDARVRLVGDDGTNTKLPTKKDGSYSVKVSKDARYTMLATGKGYMNQSALVSTVGLKDSHTYDKNFALTLISKPVKMENVHYEFNKWTLSPESTKSMESLAKLLKDNPNIAIELSAHTDMVGDSAYNQMLSQRRAQSCVDYLIKAGIAKERLTAKGYGKSQPVVVDALMHRRNRWMPEGQELNEEFIKSLTQEQQETCNKINRRTEFKVTRTTYGMW